jgi:hypothetical protein
MYASYFKRLTSYETPNMEIFYIRLKRLLWINGWHLGNNEPVFEEGSPNITLGAVDMGLDYIIKDTNMNGLTTRFEPLSTIPNSFSHQKHKINFTNMYVRSTDSNFIQNPSLHTTPTQPIVTSNSIP